MKASTLLAVAGGIFAASMSSVYAQSDDDKKKPIKPAELILSQSDDESKKPKKPGGEKPELQPILAQSDDEPKKPKKPGGPKLQPLQS